MTSTARKSTHRSDRIRKHKLSACDATGLPRYRDRRQARDAAAARTMGTRDFTVSTFACPDCRGFHHETMPTVMPIVDAEPSPVPAFVESMPSRPRRYFLVDIENLTQGAKASPAQAAGLWTVLRQQAAGIAAHDHVVIGAARTVVRKYRPAIGGANVRWVVGADRPDGADRALLAAVNLHQVARDFDELVIASGDQAFTGLARRARAMGLSVQIITTEHQSGRTMLAAELADTATTRTRIRLSSRRQRLANVTALHAVAQAATDRHDNYAVAA